MDSDAFPLAGNAPDHTTEDIIEQEDLDDLIEHIKKLPEIYSSPLLLRFHHDYTISQISDALDEDESTIRTRISRAKRMLAEVLEEEDHHTV